MTTTTTLPVAGTYKLDPSHTSVEFVARHLMISKVRGGFTQPEGTIHIDEVPERSSVEVTIPVDSLNSGDAARDQHLLSADFFDVEKYPTITFKSTAVEHVSFEQWKVTGDLTVHGVTKPVELDVEFEGSVDTPFGDSRIGFSASTEVNREDWGLTWNVALETGGFLVSKTARIEISVQAVKQ